MKTKNLISAVMMLLAFSFTSCETTPTDTTVDLSATETIYDSPASDDLLSAISYSSASTDSIIDSEMAGLLQMREEEKMAHDVYTYFYSLYEYRIFNNISKSETRHSDAVLSLINYLGLTDPAVAETGKFTNADIQNLYNQLTASGTTVEAALSTGAYIEEYDIADLKRLVAETTNVDIVRVYSNLLKGSEFHLKAFTTMLKFKGIVYTPVILSVEEYNEIIL